MEPVKGYVVLTETISGPELIWRTGGGDEQAIPQVFATEREAQLEIVDDIETELLQFKEGEREWDKIHWPDQYTVAEIEIDESGMIRVYSLEGGTLVAKEYSTAKIMEVTLQQWRENL